MSKLERITFFLIILLLPTQLGRHFWPSFSFIFSLRVDYLSPTVYLWDVLVLILVGLWVFRRPAVDQRALGVLLIFLLTAIFSLVSSNNLGVGLVRLEQYVVVGVFGIYIASQEFMEISKLIFWGLVLAIVYIGLLAILETLLGRSMNVWVLGERSFSLITPSIATFNFNGQLFLRPYASFPHPNVLSAFCVIAIALISFISRQIKSLNWPYYFNVALAALVALLSFSRAGVGVLFLEGLIILRKRIWVLLVIIFLIFPVMYVRYSSAFNFDNLSFIRRGELVDIAWSFFKQSPFLGIGLNNFINEVAVSALVSGPSRFLQPVHNIFLLHLAETGLVGFLGLCVLIVTPVGLLWKFRIETMYLLIAWMAIFLLGMVDHYFLTLPQGIRLLFLVWGLSFCFYRCILKRNEGI